MIDEMSGIRPATAGLFFGRLRTGSANSATRPKGPRVNEWRPTQHRLAECWATKSHRLAECWARKGANEGRPSFCGGETRSVSAVRYKVPLKALAFRGTRPATAGPGVNSAIRPKGPRVNERRPTQHRLAECWARKGANEGRLSFCGGETRSVSAVRYQDEF